MIKSMSLWRGRIATGGLGAALYIVAVAPVLVIVMGTSRALMAGALIFDWLMRPLERAVCCRAC